MRFKAWCQQCGHSAVCHESRRFHGSGMIVLLIATLLAGSLVLFGNLR